MSEQRNEKYDPSLIEPKWQKFWESTGAFCAVGDGKRPKYYLLEMLPYPSGKIHMGHVRNYTIGDAAARFRWMKGFDIMHPIGWDAFGLPAENAAIQKGIHPAKWTYQNIAEMRRQLKRLGLSYDWDREIATCHEKYYKWEQWFFNRLLDKGVVYRKKSYVNYCPDCETVLANEQVVSGKCWRCGSVVEQKELEQWCFRITDYAEELLRDLDKLEEGWPERVVTMQRNWIGRSEGARVEFELPDGRKLEVFTTRPDTLYGVTFLSVAPEHPLVSDILSRDGVDELRAFVEDVLREGMISRTSEESEKRGMYLGIDAIHPLTGEKIPVFVANFVVMSYGTGAVMAVPAHDTRDFAFAKKHGLPIKVVIKPKDKDLDPSSMSDAYTEPGVMVDSGPFTGMDSTEGISAVTSELSKIGKGGPAVSYRLRDWGVSRQRYWGAPIPVIYCGSCGVVPVPDDQLPVKLPEDVEFTGKGGNPLAAVKSFVNTKCPCCGAPAKRETDTLDTFVESSWYFLRYLCPRLDTAMVDKESVSFWMPVDMYIGGIEHAVGHLIYARYFTKLMRDEGLIDLDEPFKRLITQGMVLKDGEKMSKSKGNVVDPDDMIEKYGADTTRLFTLFAAPVERDLEWNERGVEGAYRFINRVWRLTFEVWPKVSGASDPSAASSGRALEIRRKTHKTLKKVTLDIEKFRFNTAISAVMELTNDLYAARDSLSDAGVQAAFREALYLLPLMLYPMAPHVCAELYEYTTGKKDIHSVSWPEFDPSLAVEDEVVFAVQVNGKLRGQVKAPKEASKEDVEALARKDSKVSAHLSGKKVIKVIFVPGRLINFVVK